MATSRSLASLAAHIGVGVSAAMLAVTVVQQADTPSAYAAATDGGRPQVIQPVGTNLPGAGNRLDAGGSSTPFSLLLPTGAACTGDSANDGYRVQSYMVPSSVAPSSLTFDSNGPVKVTGEFRFPLYQTNSNSYVDAQTANADPVPGPGPIINIPGFNLAVFEPGDVPAGTYNVGIACTKGTPSATQLDKFFNTQVTITTAASDTPAQVTFAVAENGPPTSGGGGSSTTSSTSTTVAGGSSTTSTTAAGGSTTTTAGGGTTTTTAAGGGAPTTSTALGGSAVRLPTTGSSTLELVVWACLLLTCGRIAFLLRRGTRQQLPGILPD